MNEELRLMVERRHSCRAELREVVQIEHQFEGDRVWHGEVYVLNLIGHPHASVAFAWEESLAGSPTPVMHAVLGIPPIDSPMDAVRHIGNGLEA
jgi:hypothetical protein